MTTPDFAQSSETPDFAPSSRLREASSGRPGGYVWQADSAGIAVNAGNGRFALTAIQDGK